MRLSRDRIKVDARIACSRFAPGAAIHYNWWAPLHGFGKPGSHGCLGMRLDGSKYMWK